MPTKQLSQQIAVRLPADLLVRVDERAHRYGMSRNAWIQAALTRLVDMPRQRTLREEDF